MSQTRNNYKAKWLAAASAAGNDVPEKASQCNVTAESVISTEITTKMEIDKLQTVIFEAAAAAKRVTATMNEFRVTGDVDYGSVDHGVDGKLGKMPLFVIVRRMRDILKHAEFRIGMLSTACDELTVAGKSAMFELHNIQSQNAQLGRTTLDTMLVGHNATEDERDDYSAERRAGHRYHRYGQNYPDLSDDYFENFGMHANHGHQMANHPNDLESDDDSDSDTDKQIVVKKGNTPTQLVDRNSNKRDSAIAGLNHLIGQS